jgi:serine phosphatase RsbU (regulator of sigma subunit)
MDHGAKTYARRILLVHMLLLAALIAAVGLTSRQIYNSARQQAIVQATGRQELLTAQTVKGIEAFYSSVISDLELFRRRAENEDSAQTQPSEATPQIRILPGAPAFAAREPAFLWNQLNGRVSGLFAYNRGVRNVSEAVDIWEPHEDVPPAQPRIEPQSQETPRRGGLLQPRRELPAPPVTPEVRDAMLALAGSAQDWLNQVDRPSVSDLLTIPPDSPLASVAGTGGVNLVAVPFGARAQWIIVAVVPAAEAQSRLLPSAQDREITSATLVDNGYNVIMSSNPLLIGTNIMHSNDAEIQGMVEQYLKTPQLPATGVEQPMSLTLGPRLVTISPVTAPEAKWTLLVSSPLTEVDRVVANIFGTVLYWAAFLVLAMTAILVSTGVQFVRNRARLERVQHDVLRRQLQQAREIQLNWLPSRHSAGPALDIAAINQPASHISGDFYNWFDLPDGRVAITIGDVTGHGMAAAFLMATTQLLVRTTMPRLLDPGLCMQEVNRQLCTQVFRGQFVTMLILLLDLERSTLKIATAGHAAPLVSKNGGPFAALPMKSQLVLAVDENQVYPTENYQLDSRTSLLLYTDGVIDVQSPTGDRLDSKRLREILSGQPGQNIPFASAQSMIDHVLSVIDEFRHGEELEDDLTLVAIQTQPVPKPKISIDRAREKQPVLASAN